MKFLEHLKPADAFSLGSAALGCAAVFLSIRGAFAWAASAILAAGVFDMLDGKIARLTGTANAFGRELDSLADVVSFGVAPVVFGFSLIPLRPLNLAALGLYLLCGVLRVANYNVSTERTTYQGMPITMNAVIFPSAWFFKAPIFLWCWIFFISAVLMIAPIKFRKPALMK